MTSADKHAASGKAAGKVLRPLRLFLSEKPETAAEEGGISDTIKNCTVVTETGSQSHM